MTSVTSTSPTSPTSPTSVGDTPSVRRTNPPDARSDRDGSAIHDLGYQRYTGSRIGARGAWRALVWQGFRAMFGLGRTAKAKVIPMGILGVSLLPALGMVAAAGALAAASGATGGGGTPGGLPPMPVRLIRYAQYVDGQVILFVLFCAAQAPELLSRDQQYRVLPLILTRDVTRTSYATARAAAIMSALFLVALAPLFLLYIGEISVSLDPAATFRERGLTIFPVLLQAAMTAITIGGISAALAALTPRRAYATAAIIGVFLVTVAMSEILGDMRNIPNRVSELISPLVALRTEARLLFDERTRRMDRIPPIPTLGYLAYLGSLGALGMAIMMVRIKRVRV